MILRYFLCLLFASVLFACNDNEMGNPADSFFYASINGPSWNGELRITSKNYPQELNAQAVIGPSTDPGVPDALIISFDNFQSFESADMTIPAEERLTELTDEGDFGMAISDGSGILLISKTLSIHVTTLETGGPGFAGVQQPSVIVANFEGVMVYKNEQNQEEAHTVKGDFKYYSE